MKDQRVTKIFKEIKFEGDWVELEAKAFLQRDPFTKYLTLTAVFIGNSALREIFHFLFSTAFC